jgi:hypothetical protein
MKIFCHTENASQKKLQIFCQTSKSRWVYFIIGFLSLLIGLFVFSWTQYENVSLKIYAKTFEKGTRTVFVKASDHNLSLPVEYENSEEDGNQCLFPVVLPAVSIESIKIAPLGNIGTFEITRIDLINGSKTYSWDEQLGCSQISRVDGVNITKPCDPNAPKLITNSDSSLDIIGTTPIYSKNSFIFRWAISIGSILLLVVSAVWGLRLIGKNMPSLPEYSSYALCSVWLVGIFLYTLQLYFIVKYSIDMPAFEEWWYFGEDALPRGLTLKWLFDFAGDQMIVFTKLMAWINFKLLNLNFTMQLIVNYLFFGLLLLSVQHLKYKVVTKNEFILFPAFIIFLISNNNYENHGHSAQSSLQLVMIFSVIALFYTFENNINAKHAILLVLILCSAILSYSVGFIIAAIYLMFLNVYTIAGIAGNRIDRRNLSKIWLASLPIASIMAFWYFCYKHRAEGFIRVPAASPLDSRVWAFFFNLVSFGFGFKSELIIFGIICFVIVVCPLLILVIRSETRWLAGTWRLAAATTAIIVILFIICVNRALLSDVNFKQSRYSEYAFMLIPYTALAWWMACKNKKLRNLILTALWIMCFINYRDTYSDLQYRKYMHGYIFNFDCLQLLDDGGESCSASPKFPLDYYFNQAKKMDIKFTRQFKPASKISD